MIQFGCRKQRYHTGYYKESTPFCRKTIINHCRIKLITENILELNSIKHYLFLPLRSVKIFSNLQGSSSKQLVRVVDHVHRLFMFQSYSQRPLIRL